MRYQITPKAIRKLDNDKINIVELPEGTPQIDLAKIADSIKLRKPEVLRNTILLAGKLDIKTFDKKALAELYHAIGELIKEKGGDHEVQSK